ncbi:7TM diverse intracellular signaling domain-containing protein [Arenicella xantha]|uniref:7TM diverse intracellular signaling domain-containing protein n=1 Tax=Arenicella xantha TaxID=644221 RepID=UPI001473F6EF|nr:7TM diverse intracellular signaling domain-containing protein [Arenicella xantha]
MAWLKQVDRLGANRVGARALLVMVLLVLPFAGQAASRLVITDDLLSSSNVDLQAYTLVLPDPDNAISASQAVETMLQHSGLQSEFDSNAKYYWFLTPLKNHSSESHWSIRSNNVLYDSMEFYWYCKGQPISKMPQPELGLNSANLSTSFYVDLTIPADTECGFLQQASVTAFYPVQIYLLPSSAVLAQSNLHTVLNLMGFGIIIGLVIYNLLLSASLRSSTYLLYSLYASIHFLLLLLVSSRHTIIDLPSWNSVQWFRFLSASLMVMFIWLTLKFMQPGFQLAREGFTSPVAKRLSLALKRLSWIPVMVMLCFAFEAIFWPQHLGKTASIYPPAYILCSLFIPIISLSTALTGYRPAWVFLSAWSILIATHILGSLDLMGVIELGGWSRTQAVLGGATEMILLSIALGMSLTASQAARQRSRLARQRAETMMEQRDKFLSTVSHEIRTPLHAMLGASELLGKTSLNQQQKRYWTATHYAAESLYALTDNLLDRNQPEQQHAKQQYDPARLVDAMVQLLRHRAEEKGLQVVVDLQSAGDSSLPAWLEGNPVIIRRLLINLISNAVKYTESGTISVTAGWHQDSGMLQLEIRDTGKGMSRVQLERVRQALNQRVEVLYSDDPSSGLGLAICQELTNSIGGTLAIDSQADLSQAEHGTVVTISLPMQEVSQVQTAEVLPNEHLSRTVLVVDDLDSNRMIASELLSQAGHRVLQARSGSEALLVLAHESVDVVLSDLRMPEMDGEELLNAIRSTETTRDIRFVISSAHLSLDVQARVLRRANTQCLPKPYSRERLLSIVEIDGSSASMSSQPVFSEPSADTASQKLLAELGAQKMSVLMGLYNEQILVDKQRIAEGLECQDAAAIKVAAHRIVSASQTLGVLTNAQTAAHIEDEIGHIDQSSWSELHAKLSIELKKISVVGTP